MGAFQKSLGGAEMFQEALNYFGGLLGFGGQQPSIPAEYYAAGPVAPMPADMQGPPLPPPPGGVANRPPGPFERFTPEQRQQMGYGAIADAFMQMGGRQGTALNSMMNAFDTQAGRTPQRQVAAQQEPGMQPVPMIQMPPVTMPQMRPMALNIPSRTGYRVPSLLGI